MSNNRRRRDRDGPRGTGSSGYLVTLLIAVVVVIITANANNADASPPPPTGTILLKDTEGGSDCNKKVDCWACQGNRQCSSRFMTVKLGCDVCFKKVINKDCQGKMRDANSIESYETGSSVIIKGCHKFREVSNNGWKLGGCAFVHDFFHGKDVYLCLCNDRHQCNLGPPSTLVSRSSWLLMISLFCVLLTLF